MSLHIEGQTGARALLDRGYEAEGVRISDCRRQRSESSSEERESGGSRAEAPSVFARSFARLGWTMLSGLAEHQLRVLQRKRWSPLIKGRKSNMRHLSGQWAAAALAGDGTRNAMVESSDHSFQRELFSCCESPSRELSDKFWGVDEVAQELDE